MLKRISIVVLITILVGGISVPVLAEKPVEAIRTSVDKIVEILNDPQYDEDSRKAEQKEKMKREIQKIFDFKTMARGTLRHYQWESFSEQQKEEFIGLFTQLLGDTYLERIQGEYNDEKVEYLEQEMLTDTRAVVKTNIVRASEKIPVDYRLINEDGSWKVYNVYVERTSLVSNYRDQFGRVLMSGSPADLIERLREKVKKS
jgi:phospholipid transport system substrate-binding protein